MVRLCFALLLLHKEQDGIHMPRGLMDNLEGEVANEEFHKRALWHDMLSADLNCEDSLLLNIGQHCAFGVAHNISRLVCCERVGKVPQSLLNVVSECILALVRNGDVALGYSHGIHRMMIVDHHRLLRRLGVEDAHRDLLAPLGSFLLQIRLQNQNIYDIMNVTFSFSKIYDRS